MITVRLSQQNREILCHVNGKLYEVSMLSLRGARREITGYFVNQGYRPRNDWKDTPAGLERDFDKIMNTYPTASPSPSPSPSPLAHSILMLKVDADNEAGLTEPNNTIRDYLKALLTQLWLEKEEFSGKRPFGNSSWEYDLYKALIRTGHIAGTIDDDGYLDTDCDDAAGDALITQAIEALL